MNNSNNIKPEFFPEPNTLALDEQAFARSVLEDEDLELRLEDSREAAQRKLWLHFQSAAAALTQLYKDRGSSSSSSAAAAAAPAPASASAAGAAPPESSPTWLAFQTSAGSLTHLYRDAADEIRSSCESGRRAGYQRCRKDLVQWARSKRRYIRREELLSLLASMSNAAIVTAHAQTTPTSLAAAAPDGAAVGGVIPGRESRAASALNLSPVMEMLELSSVGGGLRGGVLGDSPTGGGRRPKRAPPSPSQDVQMDSPVWKKTKYS